MSNLTTGKQWRVTLVGDIPPEWGDNDQHIGMMLHSAINMNMALMAAFRWSAVEFSMVGHNFPQPNRNQPPK